MNAKTSHPPKAAKGGKVRLKPHRYYKGRPVYTEAQAADKKFAFPYPPEPEWEAEWRKRKAAHPKK